MKLWDKYQAAEAWGITPTYAMMIMSRVPGAELKIVDGKARWVVPEGSEKPTSSGKKRHKSERG